MKRKIAIFLSLCMCVFLAGCSGKGTEQASINVYSYNADAGEILKEEVNVEKKDMNIVFSEFSKKNTKINGVKINSFETEEVDGVKTGYLDLSSNILDIELEDTEEELLIKSLVYTFTDNFGVEELGLTVDGGDYETEHLFIGEELTLNQDTNMTDYIVVEEAEEEPVESEEEDYDSGEILTCRICGGTNDQESIHHVHGVGCYVHEDCYYNYPTCPNCGNNLLGIDDDGNGYCDFCDGYY